MRSSHPSSPEIPGAVDAAGVAAVRYRLTDRFPEPLLEHCMRELLHLSHLAAGTAPAPRATRSRST